MKLTVMVVVVVILLVLVMMVVVGKRKTTTSTPQILPISQIPPQNIQLDKLLLIKAANLTTAVTVTTNPPYSTITNNTKPLPSPPPKPHQYQYHSVRTTNKILKYSTPTAITFATITTALTTPITNFVTVCTGMEGVLRYLR